MSLPLDELPVSGFVMVRRHFGAGRNDRRRPAHGAWRWGRALAPALGLLAFALPLAGCTTHQCDAATVSLGGGDAAFGSWRQSGSCAVGGGELIWQSSSFVEPWLSFPGERTYVLEFAPLPPISGGGSADPTSVAPSAWLSLSQVSGDAEPANYVQNGGQLAIFEPVPGESPLSALSVWNPSCAKYYLRVEVRVPLWCADAATLFSDGGSDDKTGVPDGADASGASAADVTGD